jgi:hypothetical protein
MGDLNPGTFVPEADTTPLRPVMQKLQVYKSFNGLIPGRVHALLLLAHRRVRDDLQGGLHCPGTNVMILKIFLKKKWQQYF